MVRRGVRFWWNYRASIYTWKPYFSRLEWNCVINFPILKLSIRAFRTLKFKLNDFPFDISNEIAKTLEFLNFPFKFPPGTLKFDLTRLSSRTFERKLSNSRIFKLSIQVFSSLKFELSDFRFKESYASSFCVAPWKWKHHACPICPSDRAILRARYAVRKRGN